MNNLHVRSLFSFGDRIKDMHEKERLRKWLNSKYTCCVSAMFGKFQTGALQCVVWRLMTATCVLVMQWLSTSKPTQRLESRRQHNDVTLQQVTKTLYCCNSVAHAFILRAAWVWLTLYWQTKQHTALIFHIDTVLINAMFLPFSCISACCSCLHRCHSETLWRHSGLVRINHRPTPGSKSGFDGKYHR